ncbi:MAG: ATP-binding protein [Planctomycetota bacterium]
MQSRERALAPFGLATVGLLMLVTAAHGWLVVRAGSTTGLPVIVEFGLLVALSATASALAYRWLRKRLLAMAALREAVLASVERKAAPEELRIGQRFGAEAAAWNALLERLEAPAAEPASASPGVPIPSSGDASLTGAVCAALWQGVLVVDAELRVCFANEAAAMLLNADPSKLAGADIADHLELDGLLGTSEGGRRELRRSSVEVDRSLGDTRACLRVSVRACELPGHSVLVVEDVTQLNAAEDARANFVAHATHELRTPLTNMRLYAETAISDECDEAMLGTCLNVINQEVRRLERVVSDMLSVSEMEAGALSIQEGEARSDQLFEELRGEFVPQATAKSVDLRFKLPPKLPVIRGDRDKLLQACHNVLGNAIKYTPEGGEVDVVVDSGVDGMTIEVRDTGAGISAQDRDRIFERFYRADDARSSGTQGTGLGLTLAKEIMLCHEGSISVDSEVGKGSVFTLSIPSGRLVA